MAEPISSTPSVAAGVQLAALAATQAQQAQARPVSGPGNAAPAAPAAPASNAGAAGGSGSTPATAGQGGRSARTARSSQDLGQAVRSLEDYIKPQQTITLQVDKNSGEPFLKIVDTSTNQMILQIPSAQVLAMARKLQEMADQQAATGGLVDQQG